MRVSAQHKFYLFIGTIDSNENIETGTHTHTHTQVYGEIYIPMYLFQCNSELAASVKLFCTCLLSPTHFTLLSKNVVNNAAPQP